MRPVELNNAGTTFRAGTASLLFQNLCMDLHSNPYRHHTAHGKVFPFECFLSQVDKERSLMIITIQCIYLLIYIEG
jgi:hypothetical protein